nr:phage repressor protein CI [Lelliottia amnigena]
MDFNSGGKKVIERLVEAYGFTTRQALCDHLGVSKSTMATRYMRDIFPADWVIQCVMETAVSIEWLSFGTGVKKNKIDSELISLPKYLLQDGELKKTGSMTFDKEFLPECISNPMAILQYNNTYICDSNFEEIHNGNWVIDIDGIKYIRSITRLPGNKISIQMENLNFSCKIDEVEFLAKAILTCSPN